MQRKAKAGHVTGGRVFGYDNEKVLGPDGQRSHVERRINEAEAAVVRRIFTLCADGAGLTRITKALNEDRVPAPRPQQGRPRAWTGSTVRDVLQRELYRGVIVWNRTRKRDAWGRKRQAERPEGDWLRLEVPELRLVSEELWNESHAQFDRRRALVRQRWRSVVPRLAVPARRLGALRPLRPCVLVTGAHAWQRPAAISSHVLRLQFVSGPRAVGVRQSPGGRHGDDRQRGPRYPA
jgi:Recombinase